MKCNIVSHPDMAVFLTHNNMLSLSQTNPGIMETSSVVWIFLYVNDVLIVASIKEASCVI